VVVEASEAVLMSAVLVFLWATLVASAVALGHVLL
jgi:hypothetical protein